MSTVTSPDLSDFPLRHKPWRFQHVRWLIQELAGATRQPEQAHRTHLRATLEWACRAQAGHSDTPRHLMAAGWSFESGWQPECLDTTGWMIETLLPAADFLDWPELATRARDMLGRLLATTESSSPGKIHGLIAGHVQLAHPQSLAHAVRCGHALDYVPNDSIVRHAQLAHALAAAGAVSGDASLMTAARRHLDIVLAQQTPCGWFPEHSGRIKTAVSAAIVRSLIECSRLLDEDRARLAALRAAQGIRDHQRPDGGLAGAFDDGWMPAADHVCMVGLAQMAVCWLRLAKTESQRDWQDAAWAALSWIKRNQRTAADDPALHDALPSAVPIWRGPSAFRIDTLSAKHFADALMMDMVGITIPPETDGARPA